MTGDPGWPGYAAGARPAMIFAAETSEVSKDPFAHARGTWAGLDWQPGTWWPVDGLDE